MTGETAPLITFIIPAFKGKQWIGRAAGAILDAEKKAPAPIEILICDDCSGDGTYEAAEELARKDGRIRALRNERNGGVCHSRNKCLAQARGTWICFADQDDALDAEAFGVFRKTLDERYDIIYYGFEDFFGEGGEIPAGDGNPGETAEFGAEEIRRLQWDCLCRYRDSRPLVSWRLLPVPWGKVYRRAFLEENGIRFREGLHREEDIGFNFTALAHCRRAKLCPYPLYHYRRALSSESHTYRPEIRKETEATLAWYREIMAEHYAGDGRMDELYRFRELWGTLYNIALGCGHAKNPHPYRERKAEFRALFESEALPAGKALDREMIRRLDPLHRVLGTLAAGKHFRAIWLLGKMEPMAYRLKIR